MSESFTASHTASVISTASGSDSEVSTKIRDIVASSLDVRAEEVTPEASFIEDLGADSLDVVDLAIRFENAFSLSIKDKDYMYLTRLCDASAYIEARLRGESTETKM
jgi:acyl carrier protein